MKLAASSPPATQTPKRGRSRAERVKSYTIILGSMVALLWVIEIIDQLTGDALQANGIHPRQVDGLIGVLTSPFLHGEWGHLISNTIPLAFLGFFVLIRGVPTFIKVTVVTAVVGGLLVWLVGGSATNHIGASGVIFGYFGFILGVGVFERSVKSILAAALVGFLYGGMIFGVFPNQPGVSWEGHLFGFLAGAGYAFAKSKEIRAARARARVKP